jgi:hypothetical protein
MANLMIQDTFEPYYAERDGLAGRPARKSAEKAEDRKKSGEILVPADKDRPRDGAGH